MIPKQISRLIQEFSRLPGIGPNSAERLSFYLLKRGDEQLQSLSEAVANLKKGIVYCQDCCNLSETEICRICDSAERDRSKLCIVEEAMDVFVLEETGIYNGLYHVLHGAISPIDGVGPEHLTIDKLSKRLDDLETEEIIMAMNPNVTGEATSVYLTNLLKPRSLRMTHLAQGLPMGGELEFADQDTLKRAMAGRREV